MQTRLYFEIDHSAYIMRLGMTGKIHLQRIIVLLILLGGVHVQATTDTSTKRTLKTKISACLNALRQPTTKKAKAAPPSRIELIKKLAEKNSATPGDLQFFLNRFYGEELAHHFTLQLTKIHPDLAPLLFDAGVLHHLPQFIEFLYSRLDSHLTAQSGGPIDPWQLRQEFSTFLGTKKVFRAITLTKSELSTVRSSGIESLLLRNKTYKRWHYFYFFLNETYNAHSLGVESERAENSYLLSISEIDEVSVAVANTFRDHDKDVYLFELDIPVLDILPLGDKTSFILPSLDPPKILHLTYESHSTKEKDVPFSRQLESFIMLRIEPHEIVSITRIDQNDPRSTLSFKWD